MQSVIEAGIEAREFRSVESCTAALSLLGMCNWVAWWFSRRSDIDSALETVTDLATAMLLVRAPAAPVEIVDMDAQIRTLLDQVAPVR